MSPPSGLPWVDLVCVLVLVAYGIGGLRSGFIATGFALAGFVGGGALGLVVLPQVRDVLPDPADRPWVRPLLVIGLAVLMALLGQALGSILGHRLRRGITSRPAQVVDALGGVAVALVTTVLGLWLVAGAVRATSSGGMAADIGDSRILGAIDQRMPPAATRVATDLRARLVAAGLPRVFEGLTPEPISPAAPPQAGELDAAALDQAQDAVVRIDGAAPCCGASVEGSGWVFGSARVITNAHVVAGTDEVSVTAGTQRLQGRVVLFDPAKDVAVLAVPGLQAAPLSLGAPLAQGAPAAALGFPLAGDFQVAPMRVRGTVEARGRDIYGQAEVTREVYSLRGTIRPGNSGGPLVDAQGQAVGLVFARSLDDAETGYALTLAEIQDDLRAGEGSRTAVPTGACARL